MEWPPHSGVLQSFPEIDRVEWFEVKEARRKLKAAQVPFLDRLQAALAADTQAGEDSPAGTPPSLG
jgi:predicted NUDIX family NTP pyrophosphohydrolase